MAKLRFCDRVKAAREHGKFKTRRELAEAVQIPERHIERMENRKDGKHSYYTAQIADKCGVNPLWLATGDGEMVRPQDLPEDARAVGAAWSYLKGAAKDMYAHSLLSTALSFMPTTHPLWKTADRLYRESMRKAHISQQLKGERKASV